MPTKKDGTPPHGRRKEHPADVGQEHLPSDLQRDNADEDDLAATSRDARDASQLPPPPEDDEE